MRKNKLLLLLALLLTAATGARAQWTGGTYTATANENLGAITVNGDATLTINSDVTVTVTGGINVASGTLTVTGPGTLVVTGAKGNDGASGWKGDNGGNGGVAISGNIIVQGGATVTATGGTGGNGGNGDLDGGNGGNGGVAFAGTLTYKSGTVTANGGSAGSGGWSEMKERYASSGSAGKAFANDVDFTQTTGYSVTNGTSSIGSVLNQTKVVISGGTEPAAAATYTVSLKDGVKDADKWTISPNPAEEGQTVTLQYTGRLKVKGVTATSEAAPAATPTLAEATAEDYGKVVCAAGHLHDAKTAVPTGCTAVGILGKVTETGHGLILALQDATSQTWNTINDWKSVTTYAGTTLKVLPDDAARGTNLTSYTALGETAVSNWAVAGEPDYQAIFKNLGGAKGDWDMYVLDSNVNAYITTGVGGSALDGEYWTAWTADELMVGDAVKFYINNWTADNINNSKKIRPVLGFGGEAAAKPAATVTTAPTGAEIVGVGKTTALVSGGVAEGGTLMYAVTTTNTKPTSTAGFSDAVPTAETIKASGKVYVWYYVKGDDTHSDSEIAATAIEVPVADIVWDVTNVRSLEVWGTDQSYTKEGVTLSGNSDDVQALYHNYGDPEMDGIWFEAFGSGGFTFTAPTGKAFTKIEMKAKNIAGWLDAHLLEQLGTGWAFNNPIVTWKGTAAASTVGLLTDADMFAGEPIIYIVFYLSE